MARLLSLAVFFGVAFSLSSAALLPGQVASTTLDNEVRAAYAAVENARARMNGEMSDEQRRTRMDGYRQSALDFVKKFEGNRGRITIGHFDLGRAYIDLQDTQNAAKHFRLFLDRAPLHAEAESAELFLGDCYRSLSRLGEAAALYRKFLSKYPKSDRLPYARLGLATAFFLDLRFSEAVKAYDETLRAHPEHEVAADAALQVIDALTYLGDYKEARKRLAALRSEAEEAPELQRKAKVLELIGSQAPALVGMAQWIGSNGSSLARNRGRVVVMCFFMNNNIPSTLMLQNLSGMEQSLRGRPVTFWGLTKAYKAGQNKWTIAAEAKWLSQYRANPRRVLQKELRAKVVAGSEEEGLWKSLEKPIRIPIGLAKDFDNHKAYEVRGVPCVVVIDKTGKIRLIEQGGQPVGGFQSRLLSQQIRKFAAE
ncbi:MAG: tetratricopeptide repeat protein [Planctomycetota bacterium]